MLSTKHDLYCDVANPTPGCAECDNEVEAARVEEQETEERDALLDQAYEALTRRLSRPSFDGPRHDDHEPVFQHQVERDKLLEGPLPTEAQKQSDQQADKAYADYYYGRDEEEN